MADKKLPQKLEDELNNAKLYKPSAGQQETTAQKLTKAFDDSKERAMYDEILGPMLGSYKAPTSLPAKPSSSASGGDFNSSIISRLKQLETEAKEARFKLADQISQNEKLRQENETLRAMVSGPDGALSEVAGLRRQVTQLKVKISEMETFLGDYGLVWVGNNHTSTDTECPDKHSEDVESTEETHAMSFAEFNKQVDELNAVIYSEPAQIIKEGPNQRKARLVQSSELLETVRVVFYRNGLMIKRGPFRHCRSENYKSFVRDIMDGYFPIEFQGDYPDGVVFDLKDQHSVEYIEGKTDANFDQPQMSRAQFLNRLPKTVIHKGQVMGVRGEIADMLSGDASVEASASGAQGVKPRVVIENVSSSIDRSQAVGESVKIQVKWVDQSTFIVNMFELNTVGDLKASIQQHYREQDASQQRAAGDLFDFELRSAYPPRALDYAMTLKEAGLAPNGTVHARKLE
jgi:hypothetical protein